MQRYTLTLDGIPYLIEYRYASESRNKHISNFIMLRKYDIINDIAEDKEICFIKTSDYKKLFIKDGNSVKETNELVWPYTNGNYESFSNTVFDFLPDSTPQSLIYRNNEDIETDIKTDYYELLVSDKDNNYSRFYAECDCVRIYRPHNRKHINSIISISNLINNIHFHYFCQKYDSQEIHIGKEIKLNNNTYYEYIEFYIPSVESLFGSRNVLYNEDLNLYQNQYRYFNKIEWIYENTVIENNKASLQLMVMPYSIEKVCNKDYNCKDCELFTSCRYIDIKNYNIKTFLTVDRNSTEYVNSEFNFSNTPITITLSHYDVCDDQTNKYLSIEGISPSSVVISQNIEFKLKSKIGFNKYNKSVISVISEFEYPEIKNKYGNILNIQDSYFYFNKITDEDSYWNFSYDNIEDDGDADRELWLYRLSEGLMESLKFNSAGYAIEMSLDRQFDQIFYRQSIGAKEIDDFTFNLDNIFSDWKEYPEVIFIRTMFVDKYLSKIIVSNILPLVKEQFKYCINDTNSHFRINLNRTTNDNMQQFTFIDKINCIVKKHDIAKEVKINGSSNSTIIYKTVFYKTQDSQNIRIRDGVTQNIGINLGEYLSKIVDFKIHINDFEFAESGRNDVFIIFTIPGSQISQQYGKYDVFGYDANNEEHYITSGNFTKI